ncbi:MAG: anthranilate synthase component I [Candidatus Bathyarchaeota archaeon]|nr:anthranilate synthase component I [Candidatus Bathyarchaeota archaeon]
MFTKLQKQCKAAYLLESIEGPKKLARYSFIGFEPRLTVSVKNNRAELCNEQTGKADRAETSDPLRIVSELVKSKNIASYNFRFAGGAVGYISYDAVRYWEKLPQKSCDDMGFPDAQFGFYDDGIVFDHKQRQAFYYYLSENRFQEFEKLIKQSVNSEILRHHQPRMNVTKEYFEKSVEKAKAYIAAGDIFQVVLSKRYELHFTGDLIAFYCALREINPSPYMYFLKFGDKQIVGSSPEMLVRVENRVVETFPIAGTRPCVPDASENKRLAQELLADPKERAEHVMLVDLARNDIGKIAKFGSVRVPVFMKVHRYSHVQHLVSQVTGALREDKDCFDVLSAVFPAGTVSGAPKVRAMEIIEELEPVKRGPYAGAVGYFSYNGNADFAITIRTLLANAGKAYVQAGAGIVADSMPEREWFETNHKAEAVLKALEKAGGRE